MTVLPTKTIRKKKIVVTIKSDMFQLHVELCLGVINHDENIMMCSYNSPDLEIRYFCIVI